jgi:hypothetical protein
LRRRHVRICGARESHHHQLAVDEQRVRRAVDVPVFDVDPLADDSSAEKLFCRRFVGNFDPGQTNRRRLTVFSDGNRAPVFHGNHAHHRPLDAEREQQEHNNESMHGVVFGCRGSRDARAGVERAA